MANAKALLAFLATIASAVTAAQVPEGVIAVPLSRNADQTAYLAKFQVGTPPQAEYLKIDTGSPRYAFLDPRNSVCARDSQPCWTFGTFDNLTSSTCHYAGSGFADALISRGGGDYLTDTMELGGVSTQNMYFGYVSSYVWPDRVTGQVTTIAGLSLDCQFGGQNCTNKGAYLLPQLKNASTINYMASSIYLGPDEQDVSNAQILLGGAYDRAKVDGDLFTVKMVDPHSLELSNGQTNSVNVTSIEVVLENDNRTSQTYGEQGVGVPVLLDTGVASWYLTNSIFEAVFYGLGGTQYIPGNQYQVVDCEYREPGHSTGHVSVKFGTAGKIKIPLASLVSKFTDGTCGSFIGPRGDTLSIFGDAFLRGVYAIFDQENFTISLGQVKHTDQEEFAQIPPGGF